MIGARAFGPGVEVAEFSSNGIVAGVRNALKGLPNPDTIYDHPMLREGSSCAQGSAHADGK